MNNYLISLKAAEDHIGAVLGWEGLLGGYLESGRLVQLVPEAMVSPHPFYLRIMARLGQCAAFSRTGWPRRRRFEPGLRTDCAKNSGGRPPELV
ncbi:MAG: hypothetical protein R3D78_05970 [Paracoccaceae bacterium]